MKKLFLILLVMALLSMLNSCSEGEIEGLANPQNAMDVTPFEYKGHHYLQFMLSNDSRAVGVTLDPDYIFQGDTILFEGEKYIKLK